MCDLHISNENSNINTDCNIVKFRYQDSSFFGWVLHCTNIVKVIRRLLSFPGKKTSFRKQDQQQNNNNNNQNNNFITFLQKITINQIFWHCLFYSICSVYNHIMLEDRSADETDASMSLFVVLRHVKSVQNCIKSQECLEKDRLYIAMTPEQIYNFDNLFIYSDIARCIVTVNTEVILSRNKVIFWRQT